LASSSDGPASSSSVVAGADVRLSSRAWDLAAVCWAKVAGLELGSAFAEGDDVVDGVGTGVATQPADVAGREDGVA